MAYQYVGNGQYAKVSDSVGFANEPRSFLYHLLRFEFALIVCFSALFFVKGLIVCLADGNSIMGAISYASLWAFIPFIPLVLMGVFQVFLPRVISGILYIIAIPFICFFMLLILPAVGHGRDPHAWMELTASQKEIACAEAAERDLAIAKANPNSNEAKSVRAWESWNERPYESHIKELREESARIVREWEIEKNKQIWFLQPFYPGP